MKSSEDGSNKTCWMEKPELVLHSSENKLISVALLNLITISSTWARVIDVMDSESGSRLFGAGAMLGQLCGSLFAASMAWLGPFLLTFSSLLMELAALSSKGICTDSNHGSTELCQTGAEQIQNSEADDEMSSLVTSPRSPLQYQKSKIEFFVIFEGFWLILRSPYLMYISIFVVKCCCLICVLLSESNDNYHYNIKSNCQKENICADKHLYSSFYSCMTTYIDGSYPYNSWNHSCYLCISFCCCLKFGCHCFMSNLGD